MIEVFGGIVTTPAGTREDFLNVPVPTNEDWRIVEFRFLQHTKSNVLAEVHFNRDFRHTIWSTSFSQPFTMDEKIIGGTYITVIIDNRTQDATLGAFYMVIERAKGG